MALWLMRGGRDGEYEERFLADGRIYLTWGDAFAGKDLTGVKTQQEMRALYHQHSPTYSVAKLSNYTAQVWSFLQRMKPGDWVVMPRKRKSSAAVGEILAECIFDAGQADTDYRHYRAVKWLNPVVPRSVFSNDLIYSFGAIMTICEIERNNAEARCAQSPRTAGSRKPRCRRWEARERLSTPMQHRRVCRSRSVPNSPPTSRAI